MENPTYTIRFLGRYEVGINKFLLPIKISLFFWFAGSRTTAAFVSVYLKNQGLTIKHLSVITSTSVAFQFIFGIFAGMIADRIGRVKPFLFIYGSVFILTLICFIFMPKIGECGNKMITFDCLYQDITARHSCHNSQNYFLKDSCSIVFSENATDYDVNEVCPFVPLLVQKDFSLEKQHLNETPGFCVYKVNFKNFSDVPLCKEQGCKAFEMVCSDKDQYSHCLNNRSFWILIYGILVVLYNTSRTNVYRFFDVISMDLSNQHNSDFGKQRVWSILGLSVGPPLAGFLSHMISSSENDRSYAPVFICASIFAALSLLSVVKAKPQFHKAAPTVWKKSIEFVMNLEIILFLLLLITIGISFGFIVIYGNWYLHDLGATNLLLGVSAGASALCGLPFLYTSKWFFNKIGLRQFFVLCLLSYTFYFFAFSLIREPWLSIGLELANVLAHHLFWVAAIQYCDEVAPVELQATMKVLAGSLHYNIARLGAAAIGGYVMNSYGGRVAYRVLGSLAVGYALVYGIYLTVKRLHRKKVGIQLKYDDCESDI